MQCAPFAPVRLCFCELFQHILVRVFDLFLRGFTHHSQDIHHALTNLSVSPSVTRHCTLPGHVGCHADAQRDVTRYPVDLVTVRWKSCGVKPTLKVKESTVRVVTQRFRGLECSRRPDVRTLTGSSGTRDPDRLDAHPPDTYIVSAQHICVFP